MEALEQAKQTRGRSFQAWRSFGKLRFVRGIMSEQRELRPNIASGLGGLWCRLMHAAPMWPIRGSYQCRTCGRSYPVPWAGESLVQPARLAIQQEATVVETGA